MAKQRNARAQQPTGDSDSWLKDLKNPEKSMAENLARIREFAYKAFDKLDQNKNGFLEFDELYAALGSEMLNAQEKSFISFLLANEPAIAESCDEGLYVTDGISRQDIEAYFNIILPLFS